MPFEEYFSQLAPTTLRRTQWAAYLLALGQQLDGSADGDFVGRGTVPSATGNGDYDWGVVQRAKLAVKARFPGLAPSDALEQIGLERGLPRGPGESDADYSARLLGAWDEWPWAGTAFGLLSALRNGGFTASVAQVNKRLFSLDATGALVITALADHFLVDASAGFWSKFAVILQPPFPSDIDTSSMPASDSDGIERIRRLIKQWKPASATCAYFTLLVSGRLLGFPVRTLGVSNGMLAAPTAYRYSL